MICIKNYARQKGARNEAQVYLIKEGLNKIKEDIEEVFKNSPFMNKEIEKISNILECIFYFNQLEQKGGGLKILTPNQMLSRLPIYLAQLNAGNSSEKLKNKIRQLLYSLYRLKNLQKIFLKV